MGSRSRAKKTRGPAGGEGAPAPAPRRGFGLTIGLALACAGVVGLSLWTWMAGPRESSSAAKKPPSHKSFAFTDVTLESGLDFVHHNGAAGEFVLLEIMGPGGAFLDYDGDGWLDVYCVQGGWYGRGDADRISRLYRSSGADERGAVRFTDLTLASGAGVPAYGMGCAVADYDNDGHPDIFVTRVGADVLLRNRGDGSFEDVSAGIGLAGDGYSSSAAWLDYDRDGYLDLYVAQYTELTPESQAPCNDFLGHRDYCDPSATPQTRDYLFKNLGGERLADVSLQTGIALRRGYGLAVACSDFDSDGWVDIYVANDQSPAFLWKNRGDGTFVEVGAQAGCAYNGHGVAIAGMGIVAEDLDGDSDMDLFVTNIRQFSHLFLRNEGRMFTDVGHRWGEVRWMVPYTGFGAVAIDQDHDGRLELFVANGAVSRDRSTQVYERAYAEPNQFLRRDASGRFVSAQEELPPDVAEPAVSRGLAYGDYDNDGDMDLLVFRNNARPQLLRNDRTGAGNWLMVLPVDARGLGPVLNARVRIEAGERSLVRECRVHESYLASTDPRVHFGLGDLERVDRVAIAWPDGEVEWFGGTSANRVLALQRGTGSREPSR